MRIYRKPATWILAVVPFSMLSLSGCSTTDEIQPVAEKRIPYSTFSGLRDYGQQNGFEVLTPIKLQRCMNLQAEFAAQKSALVDMQAAIELESKQIAEQNVLVKEVKDTVSSYANSDLSSHEQYSEYNLVLEDYNNKVAALQKKVKAYSAMIDEYNAKSTAYNNNVASFNQNCAVNKKIYAHDMDNVTAIGQ